MELYNVSEPSQFETGEIKYLRRKIMKLRLNAKKIAATFLAALMVTSTVTPVTVNAHSIYDPFAEGNHGVKILTFAVPSDDNVRINSNGMIETKRNVKFKLYSSTDVAWSIEAVGTEGENSINKGYVSINSKSGEVMITNQAESAVYQVTALADNVIMEDSAQIKIKVNAEIDPARATSIKLSKEMEDDQVRISDDGLTMTVDGKVTKKQLVVEYEPEYLVDNTVWFERASNDAFELSGENNDLFTSANKTTGTTLRCTVGQKRTASVSDSSKLQEFKVVINEVEPNTEIVPLELEYKSNQNYTVCRDQYIRFDVIDNYAKRLPVYPTLDFGWTLKQTDGAGNDATLTANGTKTIDGVKYNKYDVYGTDGANKQLFGYIYIAKTYNGEPSDDVIVETLDTTKATRVDSVIIKTKGKYDKDNAGNDFSCKDITINFNVADIKNPSKVYIDFEKAGLVFDKDFTIKKETLGGEEKDVYYFESNGDNLNLPEATFSDILGIASYEYSKLDEFEGSDASYQIKYVLEDLENSTWGSATLADKYNNKSLSKASGNSQINASNELVDNGAFKKVGLGYKQLTLICTKSGKEVSRASYIIRFVTDVDDKGGINNIRVSFDTSRWYSLSSNEVVHIRRGEAIKPGFYESNGNSFDVTDSITMFNPYVEYTVSDAKNNTATTMVAQEYLDEDSSYRISGLQNGLVEVTATSAVDKSKTITFELYVNEDIYSGNFQLNFNDAIKAGQISSNSVVEGKQQNMPVTVKTLDESAGIPILKWALDCDKSIAEIDENKGLITTKTSSNGKQIKVTATSADGKIIEQTEFTIAEKEGSSIKTIGEKVSQGENGVVEEIGVNAGKCKVGNTFTLVPKTYEPVNATKLSGVIVWTSSDETVATVDQNGVVNALAETAKDANVKIKAQYTPVSGAAVVETVYTLTVNGYANPIKSINAEDINIPVINTSKTIEVTFDPINTSNKKVTFLSSDNSVATVSEMGVVTGVKPGTCEIKITSVADNTITKTIKVTVGGNDNDDVTCAHEYEVVSKTVVTKATLTENGKFEITKKCKKCGTPVIGEETIAKIGSTRLAKTTYTYTSKACTPSVIVKDANGKTVAASNYTVNYSNNKNVGTAKVTITFKGNYTGTKSLNFKIKKASQKITTKVSSKKYSLATVKKKAQSFTISAKAKGKVTYSVSAKVKKAGVSVSKTGKVTVKKGTKKGTYSITVKAASTAAYNKATKTVKVTVK